MPKNANDDGVSRKLAAVAGGARTPLFITILVLAIVGGMYYAYYRKEADYFTGRNLRLLSMLTAQIEGRVEMYEDFVKTWKPPATSPNATTLPSAPPRIAVRRPWLRGRIKTCHDSIRQTRVKMPL